MTDMGNDYRLADRAAITDRIHLFCRASDRRMSELASHQFHPDAELDMGSFKGTPEDFVEWHSARHANITMSFHHVSNIWIEFSGDDDAFVESYVLALQSSVGAAGNMMAAARYVDHFQRRAGEWRIASRQVVLEFASEVTGTTPVISDVAMPTRDANDPSWLLRNKLGLV